MKMRNRTRKAHLFGPPEGSDTSFEARGMNGKEKTSVCALGLRSCQPRWHSLCRVAETPAQSCSTDRPPLQSISVLLFLGKIS